MDDAGWTEVSALLALMEIDRPALDELVAQNSKRRLQVVGDRIRACQGHSAIGMPVTRSGLEASWASYEGHGLLWHGTSLDALESIGAEGLHSQTRTHVHLAATPDSPVGKRASVQVLLAVSVDRMRQANENLWQAPNGVVLARRIPRDCIEGAAPVGKQARGWARRGQGPFRWLQDRDLQT